MYFCVILILQILSYAQQVWGTSTLFRQTRGRLVVVVARPTWEFSLVYGWRGWGWRWLRFAMYRVNPARFERLSKGRTVVVLCGGPPTQIAVGVGPTVARRSPGWPDRCGRRPIRGSGIFVAVVVVELMRRARSAGQARGRRLDKALRPAHALGQPALVLHPVAPVALASDDHGAAPELDPVPRRRRTVLVADFTRIHTFPCGCGAARGLIPNVYCTTIIQSWVVT